MLPPLKHEGVAAARTAIEALPLRGLARDASPQVLQHFTNHEYRMNCPGYPKRGWQIGVRGHVVRG